MLFKKVVLHTFCQSSKEAVIPKFSKDRDHQAISILNHCKPILQNCNVNDASKTVYVCNILGKPIIVRPLFCLIYIIFYSKNPHAFYGYYRVLCIFVHYKANIYYSTHLPCFNKN